MRLPLFQVDAFAEKPFTGNPAAVCLCFDTVPSAEEMQQIAAEMNLSETAFLLGRPDEAFDLYWFTPTQEVDLCGHATLASAHVLWEKEHLAPEAPAVFHTRSGTLPVRRRKDGEIDMDFPAEPVEACDTPVVLSDALGAAPRFTGRNRMDLLVLLSSEAAVLGLEPDFALLETIVARGVVATARAPESAGYDFVSRFFAPHAGVNEDPVTGSAHCALAPFWAERLNRPRLIGRQVSERGGTVRVEANGARVTIGGPAVTVLHGTLVLPRAEHEG